MLSHGSLALSLKIYSGTRRMILDEALSKVACGLVMFPASAIAVGPYQNPNVPAAPEERSGLVVLRVAEVAQFQEKLLRAILNGELPDVVVTPQQIVFGTQILLRNSNIAGEMKLMIDYDIPKKNQREAAIKAANTMNTLQQISITAAKVEKELAPADYEELANLYKSVRIELKTLFDLLPQKEKEKYYGYFVAVTEYEKKIAEGVYNPDIDSVVQK
ncbi:hypothetical protein ACHAWU_009139 [Discostella pseudostelligera]|uniref:Uncharacterized protein n=1 Tax=Discostella pseudostelligera TaxID=259834 RepID=A0ABD3N266_9STRA